MQPYKFTSASIAPAARCQLAFEFTAPTTPILGKRISSGCIRLTNDDVVDLYDRVKLGAKVIVLPATAARRPFQAPPIDAAFRLQNPASLSKRAFTVNAQMPSSEPKIAETQ